MATEESNRDDANLRHFASRSQQPKLLATGQYTDRPMNVYLVFDQPFSRDMDQVDSTRFRKVGTSPQVNSYETASGRRLTQGCMQDSFQY